MPQLTTEQRKKTLQATKALDVTLADSGMIWCIYTFGGWVPAFNLKYL